MFGQVWTKKHIEELKNGFIYFNSIQNYRNDLSYYRGDNMEGKILLNPQKIAIYDRNGSDIFETVPYPDVITQSIIGDEDIMMFCASMIDSRIIEKCGPEKGKIKKEFKDAVKNFGDYALIFWISEFYERLLSRSADCNFHMNKIHYYKTNDYEDIEQFIAEDEIDGRYFLKRWEEYGNQNEWRTIMGFKKGREQRTDNRGGFLLRVEPFKYAVVYETTELLEGLRYDGEIESLM